MKPQPKRRSRRHHRYRLSSSATLLLLGIGLGLGLRFPAHAASATEDLCQTILSRQQLTQLLTVPERENRQAIEAIANDPYCSLAAIEVRAGVEAERAAYPLAFDPNTWLVVLYENEEYVGYGFKLHH